MDRNGVRIIVPPHSVDKDEIVVSGDKDGVLEAKRVMLAIFEDKVSLVYDLLALVFGLLLHPFNIRQYLKKFFYSSNFLLSTSD